MKFVDAQAADGKEDWAWLNGLATFHIGRRMAGVDVFLVGQRWFLVPECPCHTSTVYNGFIGIPWCSACGIVCEEWLGQVNIPPDCRVTTITFGGFEDDRATAFRG